MFFEGDFISCWVILWLWNNGRWRRRNFFKELKLKIGRIGRFFEGDFISCWVILWLWNDGRRRRRSFGGDMKRFRLWARRRRKKARAMGQNGDLLFVERNRLEAWLFEGGDGEG